MIGLTRASKAVVTRAVVGWVAVVSLSALAWPARGEDRKVTVRARVDNPGETPVFTEFKATFSPGIHERRLLPAGGGPAVPALIYAIEGKTYFAAVFKDVHAGRDVVYALADDDPSHPAKGTEFRTTGTGLEIATGGQLLSVYHSDLATKPYFFPLIGPTGVSYTRAYPMQKDVAGEDHDHPHQRSFWFTHGSVNGFDFWSSDPLNKPKRNDGTIRETSRSIVAAGPVLGVLKTTDDWLGPDGKVVCQDQRNVRAYATEAIRVLDFDITLEATAGPVTFGDTKEGMFGLRVASSMDVKNKKGGKITNAEGITDEAAWGKASPWVDYTGPVEGKTVGVAILNHPDSFRFPTTWHVRTYGLFAANPFGWHDFGMNKSGEHVVPAGGSIHFGYRVILHQGDTASAHLPEAFRAYAQPPTIDVTAE